VKNFKDYYLKNTIKTILCLVA